MRTILLSLLFVTACAVNESDSSANLTGTEESPLESSTGAPTCGGHKVLVCHIPPGNPANEHTICVGAAAVDPHVRLHHDHLGVCASEVPGDEGSDTGSGDTGSGCGSDSGSGSGSDGGSGPIL